MVLFVFVLGGPTASTGVEQRSAWSRGPESGKADDVGLGLEFNRGLVAESLTVIFLLGIILSGEKSK